CRPTGESPRRCSMIKIPTAQVPGYYHRRIGDIVVTALSDGYLDGTLEVLQNITRNDAQGLLDAQFRPGRRTSANCYLIYNAGRSARGDHPWLPDRAMVSWAGSGPTASTGPRPPLPPAFSRPSREDRED